MTDASKSDIKPESVTDWKPLVLLALIALLLGVVFWDGLAYMVEAWGREYGVRFQGGAST